MKGTEETLCTHISVVALRKTPLVSLWSATSTGWIHHEIWRKHSLSVPEKLVMTRFFSHCSRDVAGSVGCAKELDHEIKNYLS